jgi:hypothetical protein
MLPLLASKHFARGSSNGTASSIEKLSSDEVESTKIQSDGSTPSAGRVGGSEKTALVVSSL